MRAPFCEGSSLTWGPRGAALAAGEAGGVPVGPEGGQRLPLDLRPAWTRAGTQWGGSAWVWRAVWWVCSVGLGLWRRGRALKAPKKSVKIDVNSRKEVVSLWSGPWWRGGLCSGREVGKHTLKPGRRTFGSSRWVRVGLGLRLGSVEMDENKKSRQCPNHIPSCRLCQGNMVKHSTEFDYDGKLDGHWKLKGLLLFFLEPEKIQPPGATARLPNPSRKMGRPARRVQKWRPVSRTAKVTI